MKKLLKKIFSLKSLKNSVMLLGWFSDPELIREASLNSNNFKCDDIYNYTKEKENKAA
ncbi:MAG: hypothetical protein PHX70_07510 [Clostridium sp.]|nr:hypothetical protein [Clostridium sp.]